MTQFFRKILSVAAAILVFFSTMSFTVDMHFCGDTLVDFSLMQKAETCGMEEGQNESECGRSMVSEISCCSDKQIIAEGQDELNRTFDTLTAEQQIFVAAFTYSYLNLFEGLEQSIVPFRNYIPPLLTRDIQKLHQTYII